MSTHTQKGSSHMAKNLDPWFIDGESGFHLDLSTDTERTCKNCTLYEESLDCDECAEFVGWETTVEAYHHRERERLGEGTSVEYLPPSHDLMEDTR